MTFPPSQGWVPCGEICRIPVRHSPLKRHYSVETVGRPDYVTKQHTRPERQRLKRSVGSEQRGASFGRKTRQVAGVKVHDFHLSGANCMFGIIVPGHNPASPFPLKEIVADVSADVSADALLELGVLAWHSWQLATR